MPHTLIKTLLSASLLMIFASGCANPGPDQAVSADVIGDVILTSLPAKIDKSCRNGKAKLYDECTDQAALFQQAQALAKADGKTVLVSYGADWCIWCHVFNSYIHGYTDKFTYVYGEPRKEKRYTHTMRERAETDVSQAAYDLKKYVSDNFVVVHIDSDHAPNGRKVLTDTGAAKAYDGGVPFIYSVDETGQFADNLNSRYAEIRRDTDDWYRGYDRARLLEELEKMRAAAVGG